MLIKLLKRTLWTALVLLVGLFALAVVSLLVTRPFVVPTASMADTLLPGDHMLVTRQTGELRRGSIHWFHPPNDPRQSFVKRIIGLPGDRVRIGAEAVYVNGQKLDEPYARYNPARHNPSAEGTEILVPPNCYYVLGDNREDSLDSRNFGCVPDANFAGKPLVIYWSFDTGGRSLMEARNMSFSEKLTHTRWNRTFRPADR